MSVTRRTFLIRAIVAGTTVMLERVCPAQAMENDESLPALTGYLSGNRISSTPAPAYNAYRSKIISDPWTITWVQVDLGRSLPLDTVQLFPASERIYPGRDQYYAGEGFPLRFRIEASDDAEFRSSSMIANFMQSDFPDPLDNIVQFSAQGVRARFLRVTVTRLRPSKVRQDRTQGMPLGGRTDDSPDYTFALAKLTALSAGRDAATGCDVSVDEAHGNRLLQAQLTRQPRQDGEYIEHNQPGSVTHAASWRRPVLKTKTPQQGVVLSEGLFSGAMDRNAGYLLDFFSVDDLLRQFYERTGKIKNFEPVGAQIFWEEDLAGSNAGRFLMGAGNHLRWQEHPELRRRLNAVVDGIDECRQQDGFIMAYPEATVFYSERAAYTRAWLTHGLLEAAYCGNPKALPLLRGYYDWFNRQPSLPYLLRGAMQGGQGMVANTRVCLSPVGKPEDAQVVQQYFQENEWLHGLARREKEQVWQYPYDRPHCYLLTNLEAYLDLYLITGEARYLDAVLGGWELFRDHWQHAGGSISIIEFQVNPPDSNYISRPLGELCGSSFWVFLNQRLHHLHPDDERFVNEIEKSLYNVALANQAASSGLRYHTILKGTKDKPTHHNTCCEGQGTRLLGSLPEHIYSLAPDGVYINLFEPSTIHWDQEGASMMLVMETKFPFERGVRLTFRSATSRPTKLNVRIRVPSWAASVMEITLNGKAAGAGNPGTYHSMERAWSDGDFVEFTLPATVRATLYKGSDQIEGRKRYWLEYGPILLAAAGSTEVDLAVPHEALDGAAVAGLLTAISGSPLHFAVRSKPDTTFVPYWQLDNEIFTCFPSVAIEAAH